MVADVSASLEPAQLQADDGCDLMVFSYDRPLHLLALLDTVPAPVPALPCARPRDAGPGDGTAHVRCRCMRLWRARLRLWSSSAPRRASTCARTGGCMRGIRRRAALSYDADIMFIPRGRGYRFRWGYRVEWDTMRGVIPDAGALGAPAIEG